MSRFTSVGARLSLALLLVVAAALGIVYVALVPLIERNLVDAKVDQLVQSAEILAGRVPQPVDQAQIFAEEAAPSVNARVLIVDVPAAEAPVVLPIADSQEVPGAQRVVQDPLAVRALESLEPQGGQVGEDENAYAEAAVAVEGTTSVLVLRAPLSDTFENVALVRRRLLLAGVLALAFSLAVGYGMAYLFARRLHRLERAADRISGGRFDEPIVDPAGDEIGQLAAAFDRMRLRLAGLERARRDFIANASHELRTPLFSLGGFLELLADEDVDAATRQEFLATAREQVERLTRLATDLLDPSRLDAGRVQLERAPLDLGAVARSITDEFEAVARSRAHPVETDVEGAPRGVGDEQRTIQIGRILLENALLHTPPGTRVRVSAAQENGRAVLEVADEGPGIPAGQHEVVFERFARVEGAVASGSGLGLAIARELAELMGGTIELESRSGATTFRLSLPAAV